MIPWRCTFPIYLLRQPILRGFQPYRFHSERSPMVVRWEYSLSPLLSTNFLFSRLPVFSKGLQVDICLFSTPAILQSIIKKRVKERRLFFSMVFRWIEGCGRSRRIISLPGIVLYLTMHAGTANRIRSKRAIHERTGLGICRIWSGI